VVGVPYQINVLMELNMDQLMKENVQYMNMINVHKKVIVQDIKLVILVLMMLLVLGVMII
jgi:hypothetical protein